MIVATPHPPRRSDITDARPLGSNQKFIWGRGCFLRSFPSFPFLPPFSPIFQPLQSGPRIFGVFVYGGFLTPKTVVSKAAKSPTEPPSHMLVWLRPT